MGMSIQFSDHVARCLKVSPVRLESWLRRGQIKLNSIPGGWVLVLVREPAISAVTNAVVGVRRP